MSPRQKQALFGLLALGFILRIVFMLQIPAGDYFYADGYDYSRVATAVAQGRGFYPPEMEPMIVYRAPGYPFLLGGLYKIFGIENFTAVRVVQSAAATAAGWLLFGIGMTIGGVPAGLIALGLFACHPFLIYHCATIAPETFFTFFVLLNYFFLFRLLDLKNLYSALLAGAAFGCAALIKGTILLTLPGAMLAILLAFQNNLKKGLAAAVLTAAVGSLVISPISLWAHRRWNEFSLILDGSGLNFWIGNSDTSARLFRAGTPEEFKKIQENLWMEELPAFESEIGRLGPASRDRFYFQRGAANFKKDPRRSLWMMTERFRIFWRPWVHPMAYGPKEVLVSGLASVPLFLFGFWGLLRRLSQRRPDAVFAALTLLLITLITGMIFNTEIRWRIPLIDTLLIVYSSWFLSKLFRGTAEKTPPSRVPEKARKSLRAEISRV